MPSSVLGFIRDLTRQLCINFSEIEENMWRGEVLRERKVKSRDRIEVGQGFRHSIPHFIKDQVLKRLTDLKLFLISCM